jgi:hypothetical protein
MKADPIQLHRILQIRSENSTKYRRCDSIIYLGWVAIASQDRGTVSDQPLENALNFVSYIRHERFHLFFAE